MCVSFAHPEDNIATHLGALDQQKRHRSQKSLNTENKGFDKNRVLLITEALDRRRQMKQNPFLSHENLLMEKADQMQKMLKYEVVNFS